MYRRRMIEAAAIEPICIRLCGDVEIVAAQPESKGPRAFKVKAYTGGELVVGGYPLPVVVDLAGLTMAKSVVANLHHDKKSIVGHVTEAANDGKGLKLSGVASGAGAGAHEFLASADNGFPWQASIEAKPSKVIEVPDGKTFSANGREFTGPMYWAKKSKLHGFAFVARGADENTTVTVAASAAESAKGFAMKTFEQWIEAMELDADALTDKQRAALQKKYDAEVQAAAKVADEKKKAKGKSTDPKDEPPEVMAQSFDLDEVKAAAEELSSEIDARCAEYEDEITDAAKLRTIKAEARKAALDLKRRAIKEKWVALRLENEGLRLLSATQLKCIEAKAPVGPSIQSPTKDTSAPVIEAALCMARGLPDIEKQFKPDVLEKAHTNFKGRLGLKQTFILAASANGYRFHPGESLDSSSLREILAHAFPMVRAGFSTVSLSGVLSNLATKELLAGYMDEDQSWRDISAVKSVTDFKQITSYRMLDSMEYEQLGPAGEIKHGSLGSESYTRQADTFAKMFALTRRDIINDDLGAFDDLRNRLGRGAATKFNNVFWTAMLAGHSSFFTTTRRNYITGATTTLLIDGVGLALAIKAFRQMRKPNADGSFTGAGSGPMSGMPSLLLVPPELMGVAETLYTGANLSAVQDDNIYKGKYKPVCSPWLSDSNFTGYSTTAWYLFRSPGAYPMMVTSFLNGQQSPTVDSAEADFNTLGVQFRGYHDFGCDQAEYLCGIKSKGAA